MRIGIQTWGSEGDIRPFLALGAALARRGHAVELLYTEIGERRYEDVAASLGFTARAIASPVVADRQRLFEIGLKVINTRNQLQQGLIISRDLLEPIVEPAYEAGLELARRSDLFVHHFILHPARAAADIAGTPHVTVTFAHMLTPSRFVHPPETPSLGEWGNVLEWKIAAFALNRTLLTDVNRFRKRVGLPPIDDLMRDGWPSHRLNLLASSPAFLDRRPADWPAWHQLCGFLELPSHEHETLGPDVEQFLAAGAAPVFMGFGSLMPTEGHHLDETIATFEEAARIAGCRAIVQAETDPARAGRNGGQRRTIPVRAADAAQDPLPSMRRRRPSLRRRHHAHDASRRSAVDSRAARVGSIRLVRRAASPWRRAENVAAHGMERENSWRRASPRY